MINKLFPLLNIIDCWLAGILPLAVRLSIYGALAGFFSITIYAKLSPQASIIKLKKKTRSLQREMLKVDLVFADFMRISRENLITSLRLFVTVLGPALVSALPVVFLALWIHTYLAYEAPGNLNDLVATTKDDNINLSLLHDNKFNEIVDDEIEKGNLTYSKIKVMADDTLIYSGNPLSPAMPVIHKKQWWNVFFKKPAGYILKDAPVDSIRLNISKKRVINWMPDWAAGWEAPFFIFVLLAALGIKLGFRIA
jgi:hypothetical protein